MHAGTVAEDQIDVRVRHRVPDEKHVVVVRRADSKRARSNVARAIGASEIDWDDIWKTRIDMIEGEDAIAAVNRVACLSRAIAWFRVSRWRKAWRGNHGAGEFRDRDPTIRRHLQSVGGDCAEPVDIPAAAILRVVVPELHWRARRAVAVIRVDQPGAVTRAGTYLDIRAAGLNGEVDRNVDGRRQRKRRPVEWYWRNAHFSNNRALLIPDYGAWRESQFESRNPRCSNDCLGRRGRLNRDCILNVDPGEPDGVWKHRGSATVKPHGHFVGSVPCTPASPDATVNPQLAPVGRLALNDQQKASRSIRNGTGAIDFKPDASQR